LPDYNPAVAAGIEVPQNNFASTLGTIANLQEKQAQTGLYTLQAAQQQRQYNGLMAVAEAWRSGKDPVSVGASYGLDPGMLNQYQTLEANRQFMQSHNNMLPSALEATASASRNFAGAANERAQLAGIQSENEIKAAGAQEAQRKTLAARSIDLGNNPSPENAQDMLNDHSMHMTALNRGRLQAAVQNKDTDAIRGMAADMQAAIMTPEERAKFVQPGTPAQPATQAQPAVPTQPTTLTTQRGAAAQQAAGAADVDYTKKTTEAATTARQVNTTLGNISRDAENIPVGRGMAETNEGRAWLQSVYDNNILGAKSWMPDPGKDATASYDSLLKNSGQLTRQALMQTHERAAVAYSLIQTQLPGPDTSRAGLKRVVAEWQGVNDDQDYKQRVMAKTPLAGRSDQFEADWNSNVNPLAFMLHRMDPATRSQVIDGLRQTPEGKQTLAEVQNTFNYLKKYGIQ
jgi:hypothetical protein